jgi:hypothetical protein
MSEIEQGKPLEKKGSKKGRNEYEAFPGPLEDVLTKPNSRSDAWPKRISICTVDGVDDA